MGYLFPDIRGQIKLVLENTHRDFNMGCATLSFISLNSEKNTFMYENVNCFQLNNIASKLHQVDKDRLYIVSQKHILYIII